MKSKSLLRRKTLALLVAGLFATPSLSQAATLYWDTTTTGLWSTTTNWWTTPSGLTNPGTAPGSADTVVFNGTGINGDTIVQLNAAQAVLGMTFDNTGTTLLNSFDTTSRTLTIGGSGITINSGAGAVTLGNATNLMPIAVSASQSWTNNSSNLFTVVNGITSSTAGVQTLTIGGTGNTTLSGILANGTGTLALVKNDAGTLNLGGANTFSGGIALNNGTVNATASGALGTGAITIASSGILNVNSTGTTSYAFGLNAGNGTFNVTGSALGTGTNTVTFSGNLSAFTGTLNVGTGAPVGAGKINLTNTTAGLGSATTVNVATNATVYNAAAVTHNAPITLNGGDTGESLGQLRLEGNSIWAGPVTLAGTITGTNDGYIGSNGGSATISGAIGETGGAKNLSKAGGGTIILTGTNTYTGGTTVRAGTLQIGNGGTTGMIPTTGSITLAGGVLAFNRSDNVTQGVDFGSTISGAGGITKAGAGTLIMNSATNTYTGATTVNSGTLQLDFTNLVTPTNVLASTSALTLGGGTLNVLGKGSGATNQTLGNLTLTANTNSSIVITPNGGTSTNLTLGNTWTVNTGANLLIDMSAAGTSTLTSSPGLTNNIINARVLVKDSTGTGLATVSAGKVVRLVGTTLTATNSTAGTTTTDFTTTPSDADYVSGVLTLSSNLHATNSLQINSGAGGTLNLNGNSLTLTSNTLFMDGNGNYTIQNGDVGTSGSALVVNQNGTGTLTINGPVTGGAGTLTKFGNGNLVIAGNNTYTGATTITGGTLTIGGTGQLNSGTYAGAITIGTGTGLTFNSSAGQTLSGAITGAGTFTQSGSGATTISNATYTGATSVTGGRLIVTAPNTYRSNTNVGSGAFFEANTATGTVTVGTSFDITGTGTVVKSGTGTWVLGASGIQVGVKLSAGGLFDIQSGIVQNNFVRNMWTTNLGSVNIANTAVFDIYSENVQMDALTGSGTLQNGYAPNGVKLVTIGAADGSGTFDGVILGTGGNIALTKLGTGTQTLNGANTFGGATTITDGKLLLGNSQALQNSTTTVNVANGIIFSNGISNVTIGGLGGTGDIALTDAGSNAVNLTVGGNNSTTVYSGNLSGAGSLFKSGTGVLTLSGANTYVGPTTVAAGLLRLEGATSLPGGIGVTGGTNGLTLGGGVVGLGAGDFTRGLGTGATQVQFTGSGGFAAFNADRIVNLGGANANLTWDSGSFVPSGSALILGAASADKMVDFQHSINLNDATRTIQVDNGSAAIDAKITGALTSNTPANGGLNKTGAGALTLGGTTANTYTGLTTISAGSIIADKPAGVVAIAGDITLDNVAQSNLWFTANNQLSGTGTLTFTNNAGQHGRFMLEGTNQSIAGINNNGLGAYGVIQNSEPGVAGPTNTGTGTLTLTGSGNYSFSGYIRNATGILALTKTGSGTQTLSGVQITYTGPTTLNDGTLILQGTTAYTSATTVNNGATLSVNNSADQAMNAAITLNNGATLIHNNSSATVGFWTNSQPVTIASGAAVTLNQASVTHTSLTNKGAFLDGGLKGGGAGSVVTINATNAGNGFIFRNNNTDYSGTLIVNGIASTTVNLGSGIGVGGATTGLQNADIQLNGTMELLTQGVGWAGTASGAFRMGALSGTGVMIGNYTSGGGTIVTLGNTNNSGNFSGIIANGTGNIVQIVKIGTGTQTLSGVNTYTGATTVNAGTLTISGNPTGASAMNVVGGTLNLDYSTNNTTKIADATVLTLGGGTLNLTDGSHLEIVASTTLTNGTHSSVTRSSGTSVLQMNAITRTNATVDFGSIDIATTDATNTNGILGGWATVGGADWAINSGSTTAGGATVPGAGVADGYVRAFSAYADVTRLNAGSQVIADGSTSNVRIIEGTGSAANITLGAATTTINSLNQSITGGTSAATIDPAGQALAVSNILVGAGAGGLTIGNGTNNGTLKTAIATAGGVLFLNNLSSNGITINSSIVNNNTSALIKGGTGLVTLTGVNTYSGPTTINTGALVIGGAGQLNSGSYGNTIAIAAGGTFQYSSSAAQTLSGAISGAGSLLKDTSNSVLTLTAGNSLTGPVTINTGTITLGIGGTLASTTNITIASGAKLNLSGGTNNQFNVNATWTIAGTVDATTGLAHTTGGTFTLNNGTMTSSGGAGTTADGLVGQFGAYYAGNNTTITANGNSNTISGTGGVGVAGSRILTLNAPLVTDALTVSTIVGKGNSGTAGGLTKTGLGTVTLTAANGYTGGTTISAGSLQLGNGGSTGSLATTGAITNNGNLTINRNVATTQGTNFSSAAITGSGSFTQAGSGTTTLTAANTYGGITTVNAGQLIIQGSIANNGPLSVLMAAPDDSFSSGPANPVLSRRVAASASYTLGAAVGQGSTAVSIDPITSTALNTTASIMAGTASSQTDVTMQWRTRTTAEGNGMNHNAVLSDVVNLNGTGSDVFLLEMSYNDAALAVTTLNEAAIALSGELRLGWLDGSNWVSAVNGNTGGGNNVQFEGTISSSTFLTNLGANPLSSKLGSYGVDPSTNTVWAVLNHNSDFAVIPEPSTLVLGSLFGLGLAVCGLRRRRQA